MKKSESISPSAGSRIAKMVRFKEETENINSDDDRMEFKPLKLFGLETNLKSINEIPEIPKKSPVPFKGRATSLSPTRVSED